MGGHRADALHRATAASAERLRGFYEPGDAGSTGRAIQELAGHADLTITQRYMHLTPAALDAAIRLLENRTVCRSDADPYKVLETFWRRGGSPRDRDLSGHLRAARYGGQ